MKETQPVARVPQPGRPQLPSSAAHNSSCKLHAVAGGALPGHWRLICPSSHRSVYSVHPAIHLVTHQAVFGASHTGAPSIPFCPTLFGIRAPNLPAPGTPVPGRSAPRHSPAALLAPHSSALRTKLKVGAESCRTSAESRRQLLGNHVDSRCRYPRGSGAGAGAGWSQHTRSPGARARAPSEARQLSPTGPRDSPKGRRGLWVGSAGLASFVEAKLRQRG